MFLGGDWLCHSLAKGSHYSTKEKVTHGNFD